MWRIGKLIGNELNILAKQRGGREKRVICSEAVVERQTTPPLKADRLHLSQPIAPKRNIVCNLLTSHFAVPFESHYPSHFAACLLPRALTLRFIRLKIMRFGATPTKR